MNLWTHQSPVSIENCLHNFLLFFVLFCFFRLGIFQSKSFMHFTNKHVFLYDLVHFLCLSISIQLFSLCLRAKIEHMFLFSYLFYTQIHTNTHKLDINIRFFQTFDCIFHFNYCFLFNFIVHSVQNKMIDCYLFIY